MEYIENICNEVEKRQRQYHAMAPEIVMTSSFFFEDFEDFAYGCSNEFDSYVYTRGTNPTVGLLEEKLAVLEHGERCKVIRIRNGCHFSCHYHIAQSPRSCVAC